MPQRRLRTSFITVSLIVVAVTTWLYLAPTQIAGSTRYVITSGTSMEPRFHTGDSAIVRPAGKYRIGDVVAYRSSVLRVVVLHRIIGREGNAYIFKGTSLIRFDRFAPSYSGGCGFLTSQQAHGSRTDG